MSRHALSVRGWLKVTIPRRGGSETFPVGDRGLGRGSQCIFCICCSGSNVLNLGNPTVHSRQESALGIQRESIYFHGNLQRIPSFRLSQRLHVSSFPSLAPALFGFIPRLHPSRIVREISTSFVESAIKKQ